MGGSLGYSDVGNTTGGVAPVINLSAEYARTLKGTDEIGDEYEAK